MTTAAPARPRTVDPDVATRPRDRRRHGRRLAQVVAGAVLAGYAALSVYPFAFMASGAFKDNREVLDGGHLIPRRPTLTTLQDTVSALDFGHYLLNSTKVTGLSILLILTVYPLAGYAFAVLAFPFKRLLYVLFTALLLVPAVTVLLPLVVLERNLGILGTHEGLILPTVNAAAPLAVLLLRSHFESIPRELRESATIDGAGEFRIFWQVYLPLARPALVTLALLNFVASWNEYILASVSLNDQGLFTLPLGLQNLLSANVVQWNQVMAGALLLVLPVIALFVLLQRYFVDGLTGSVKG